MAIFSAAERGGVDPAGRFTTDRPGLLQQARAAIDSISRWMKPGGSRKIISGIRTASSRLLAGGRQTDKPQWQDPHKSVREPGPEISVIDPRGNVIHTLEPEGPGKPATGPVAGPAPTDPAIGSRDKGSPKPRSTQSKKSGPKPAAPGAPKAATVMRNGKKPERTVYLVLMRHATAVEPGEPGGENDETRPLDRKGRKEARRAGRTFEALGLEFGAILASPYTRAVETAQIVAEQVGSEARIEKTGDLRPEGDPSGFFKKPRFRRAGTCILVVGHEPYLSGVACKLLGAEAGAINLRRSGAVMLRSEGFIWGPCAWLEWMITPSLTKLIG